MRSRVETISDRRRRDAGAELCARWIVEELWADGSARDIVESMALRTSAAPGSLRPPENLNYRQVLERLTIAMPLNIRARLFQAQKILSRFDALGFSGLSDEDDTALALLGEKPSPGRRIPTWRTST
jgi:hypothetical protein